MLTGIATVMKLTQRSNHLVIKQIYDIYVITRVITLPASTFITWALGLTEIQP